VDDTISEGHLAGLITGLYFRLFTKHQSIKASQIRLGKEDFDSSEDKFMQR
jgi:hypothetical protein